MLLITPSPPTNTRPLSGKSYPGGICSCPSPLVHISPGPSSGPPLGESANKWFLQMCFCVFFRACDCLHLCVWFVGFLDHWFFGLLDISIECQLQIPNIPKPKDQNIQKVQQSKIQRSKHPNIWNLTSLRAQRTRGTYPNVRMFGLLDV